jgi:protein-L-isoaspartate(D-aspartate) O-methyltransferase
VGEGDLKREDLLEGMKGRISDRVLAAISQVKRELFVPENLLRMAYEDMPLPIGHNQTISAPHMVAIMCELLDIREGMKVLEIGGGCGYHAAVMAVLAGPSGHVYTVERIPELAAQARKNLEASGIKNVTVIEGDGSAGLPEHAPFDRISVAATAPEVPAPLKEQLKKGGRLAIPVGTTYQELILVTRDNGFTTQRQMGVAFVPLIGKYGFKGQV